MCEPQNGGLSDDLGLKHCRPASNEIPRGSQRRKNAQRTMMLRLTTSDGRQTSAKTGRHEDVNMMEHELRRLYSKPQRIWLEPLMGWPRTCRLTSGELTLAPNSPLQR